MARTKTNRLPALFWGQRRRLFAWLVAFGALHAGLTIAVALMTHEVFPMVAHNRGVGLPGDFWPLLAGLAAAIGAKGLLSILEHREAERLAENYITRVRLRLYDALASAPVMTARHASLGPTMLRFVTDLSAVRQWISRGLARLIVSALAGLGAVVALALIDVRMGGAVAGVLVGVAVMAYLVGEGLSDRVRRVRRRRSRLAARITDRLRGLGAVQSAGRVADERREIRRRSKDLAAAAVDRASRVGAIRALPDAALGIGTLLIFVLGAIQTDGNVDSATAVVAGMAVLGVLAPHVRSLGRVHEYWRNYQVAVSKLDEVIGRRRKSVVRRKSERSAARDGDLVIDGLHVDGVLEEVDARAPGGRVVAVVGPSGAGKSALLAVIARLLMPDAGRIDLDGRDVTTLTDKAFAASVGVMSPDLPLIHGTIRHNITYRMKNASKSDIAQAVEICELAGDLDRLPGGLGTRLSNDDARLTSGLRIRILLARALIGDPPLLLLDDPDSGLDPAGQRVVDRILTRRRSTVLFITNSLSRARMADDVWYLDGGRLADAGPVDECLASGRPAAAFFGIDADPSAAANVIPANFMKSTRPR